MAKTLHITPIGTAEWAKVIEPGEAYERENPPEWTISLVLDPQDPEHAQFLAQIEDWYGELHGSNPPAERGWPFRDHKDENGNLDGLIDVRFKRNTVSAKGNAVPAPVIVDAKKNRWDPEVLIGNGSKVKVGFTYYGWTRNRRSGISLDLGAVQVLDLVPYEKPDPTEGFGEEEGYTLPQPAEADAFDAEPAPAPAGPVRRFGKAPNPAARPDNTPAWGSQAGDSDEEIPF